MSALNCSAGAVAFFCPTKWQLWRQILALLPRGRAWQTHEPPVYGLDVSGDPDIETLTVMQRYWAAYAEVLEYLHQRACALLGEMFCSTVSEMRSEWLDEYGFPDACESYVSLCDKAADVPGSTCADLVAAAWRRGWKIACMDCSAVHEPAPAADCAVAGCATVACDCAGLIIRIYAAESPAYVAPASVPVADIAVADATELCGPRIEPLVCLIDRMRHAHVAITYEVIT